MKIYVKSQITDEVSVSLFSLKYLRLAQEKEQCLKRSPQFNRQLLFSTILISAIHLVQQLGLVYVILHLLCLKTEFISHSSCQLILLTLCWTRLLDACNCWSPEYPQPQEFENQEFVNEGLPMPSADNHSEEIISTAKLGTQKTDSQTFERIECFLSYGWGPPLLHVVWMMLN